MTFKRVALAGLGLIASLAIPLLGDTPAAAAELTARPYAAREVRVMPRFNWNYNHMYGPAYTWPDGTPSTPDRVLVRPGLQPIGLYQGRYPHCLYGAATYRAQGGRHPCG
jgi:hypothetical protein